MDLFLKFESEAQATQYLYDVTTEYRDENGLPVQPSVSIEGVVIASEGATPAEVKKPKFLNIDIIGDIYKPTGEMTTQQGPSDSQIEVPVMQKLDGYHVNIRLVNEDASELQQFSVVPSNPVRVWA